MPTLPPLPQTLPTAPTGLLVIFSPTTFSWIAESLSLIYRAQRETTQDSKTRLDLIITALGPLTASLENLMATVQELEGKLDAIESAFAGTQSSVENLAGDLTGLKTEIQALKDQVAAGSPASQEDLDGIFNRVDGIATRATATAQTLADLAASTPEAPAPEA